MLVFALAGIPFAPALGNTLVPQFDGPMFLTPALVALLVALGLLALGSSLLNVALSTLVSENASRETQGSAFGLTQGAGSLGRTVGPPVVAGLYAVAAYWSPFVTGAVVMIPILFVLTQLARTTRIPTVVES